MDTRMTAFLLRSAFRPLRLGVLLAGCALVGGQIIGTGAAFAASGKVAIHLSNRSAHSPACKASNVDHIYVTISDVTAHRKGAGGGFQSLIGSPTPAQFDLMFASDESTEEVGSADCPIVGLGGAGLPSGKYQQIRLITVDNGTLGPVIPTNENACASLGDTVYNCVDAGGTLSPLTIPSGSKTGLKIPPGQAGRGGLKIADGQNVDLDIDVDACRALVVHGARAKGKGKGKGGGGSYSLKPTLHSGEIALNPIVSGQVVVGSDTGAGTPVTIGANPVAVPNAEVWLETDQSQTVDVGDPAFDNAQTAVPANTVVGQTTTDNNGNFVFCPVPVGNYDIVVDSETVPSAANPADATITTGVAVSANNGAGGITIPVIEGSGASVNLSPQVTTQAASTAGNGDDIFFDGAQALNSATPAAQAEIPP
jgi:hypothetical protein